MKRITCCIATKDRRQVIHQVLWSLRNQDYPWFDVLIVDDGTKDFNEKEWIDDAFYGPILKELQQKHKVKVIQGPKAGKIGAPFQRGFLWSNKEWSNPLFLRCDDDVWLDPTYLSKLAAPFSDPNVGATSGLMLSPGNEVQSIAKDDPKYQEWSKVDTIATSPNLQWFKHENPTPFDVEHLHSMQLIRASALKKIGGFDTTLFANFREESHVSWRLHVEGYKLLVVPEAEAWHLKAPEGGVRAGSSTWVDDCRKFSITKKTMEPGIHLSLSHAIGDLIMATPMLEQLRKKYPDRNISVYHPYGEHVLKGNPNIDVVCKKQFDAQRTHRVEESVYTWAATHNLSGHLTNTYCNMMGLPEIESPQPKLYGIEPHPDYRNYIVITPCSNAKLYDFSDFSYTKSWDVDKWNELIAWIKETYECDVIHLSGEEVPQQFEGTRLVNDLSFSDAFKVIAGAKALVSIDTMAAHVAAALDVPSVVMWGRTSPSMYGYDKENIINLYNQCPKNSPCFGGAIYQQDRIQCPIEKHPCMDHSVEDVKQALQSILD
jgi:ADP-heptose:LPS heptosyltransferase